VTYPPASSPLPPVYFEILSDAITIEQRTTMLDAAQSLLATDITTGRDRGADGKDGFRGVVNLDEAFLPLVANEQVLAPLLDLLSPNIRLLSSQLVVLASIGQGELRTIRTPERPGWHRDMYGVTDDLGIAGTPRMAIKCAYYLSEIGPDTGSTMFLPGSHKLCTRPAIPVGGIDPDGAITPELGQYDAVLFENRTWHAGGLNFSGAPRIALMMQYGYRWLAPVDDTYQRLLETEALSDVQRQLLGAPDRAADGSVAKGSGSGPLSRWWQQHLGSLR
jgi:hypothetical protein